jgi:small GTP-binding protein
MADTTSIKLVCIGDGAVGKSCLLISYANNRFPEHYVPTTFDNYVVNLTAGEKDGKEQQIELALWDTAGQEEYDRLRPLSYANANVVLVCYSCISPISVENLSRKWISEVNHFVPDTPIILVGCKADLCEDEHIQMKRKRHGISEDPDYEKKMAEKLAEKMKYPHIFCSAKTGENVKEVFDLAVKTVLLSKKGKKNLYKATKKAVPPPLPKGVPAPYINVETATIAEDLGKLQKSGVEGDVQFRCGKEVIPAHMAVLCSASSYFSRIFGVGVPDEARVTPSNIPVDLLAGRFSAMEIPYEGEGEGEEKEDEKGDEKGKENEKGMKGKKKKEKKGEKKEEEEEEKGEEEEEEEEEQEQESTTQPSSPSPFPTTLSNIFLKVKDTLLCLLTLTNLPPSSTTSSTTLAGIPCFHFQRASPLKIKADLRCKMRG